MIPVYMHDDVAAVRRLQQPVLTAYPSDWTVAEVLDRQATILAAAHAAGDPVAAVQPSQWLPRCVGQPRERIMAVPLTADDARWTLAREHGFADWAAVELAGGTLLDARFEEAVDVVLAGDLARLDDLLVTTPSLARARSAYGHRATLLHYLAANGVETWRQVVPSNAATVARCLCAAGADVGATMTVYGGELTTLPLVETSAHPAEAGVTAALVEVLSPPLRAERGTLEDGEAKAGGGTS